MEPDADLLAQIAGDVASGKLRSEIAEVDGFSELPAAIERTRTAHAPGKIVVDFTQ
jgi:NADPH:quinone reductase-like Zn-dependent oxidoreductase